VFTNSNGGSGIINKIIYNHLLIFFPKKNSTKIKKIEGKNAGPIIVILLQNNADFSVLEISVKKFVKVQINKNII